MKGKGLCIAGLILGIIAIVLSFIPIINTVSFIVGAIGVVFGIIGIIICPKKGMAITALILAVVAIVIALVMKVAVLGAIGEAIDEATSSSAGLFDDMTGENTDKLLEDTVDVTFGEFSFTEDDFLDETELPVTVKNKSDERASFSIKIEAVDEAGNRIDTDTVYSDDLGAGQSQECKAFTLVTSDKAEELRNATFKVIEVSKY